MIYHVGHAVIENSSHDIRLANTLFYRWLVYHRENEEDHIDYYS